MLQAGTNLNLYPASVIHALFAIASKLEHHVVASIPIVLWALDVTIFAVQLVRRVCLKSLDKCVHVFDAGQYRPTSGQILDLVEFPRLCAKLAPDRGHPFKACNCVALEL